MAQANLSLQGQHNNQGGAKENRLDRFMRNSSPTFKGKYDPEGDRLGFGELRGSLGSW
jgi:hypothetical protein